MNMDRGQKKLERKKDDRTIEYLELKYDTDIQRGLTLAKVRQKQRGKECYKNRRTKEKKRIWFTCLRQEYQNLLFFFFLYLCVVSVLFQFEQRVRATLFVAFIVVLLWKAKKAFRYSKVLCKQKEMYSPKAVVLRENTFQCEQVDALVKGDIVRLKREEKVPLAVISLKPPYKEYKQGEIFAENTGRAIVMQQSAYSFFENIKDGDVEENTGAARNIKELENIEDKYTEKNKRMKGKIPLNTINKRRKKQGKLYTAEEEREENEENYAENRILQEIFIRQGIYFQPDFFKKATVEEARPIVAVGFEEIYFPSKFQVEKFQRFMKELKKKTGVKYFFFTSQDREAAFSIGKQTGIVKEKREVLDRKQFLLLKNVALEKQIQSIRIYCGLSEIEKRQVITIWRKHQQNYSEETMQKQGRILMMSGLNQDAREKTTESCVYACCNSGSPNAAIWFKRNWREAIVKYLAGETIWRKFFRHAKKWEKQILASLCIFMFLSLLLTLYIPQPGKMQNIMQTGSLYCATYIIGKEIVEEGFHKWFLRKLSKK